MITEFGKILRIIRVNSEDSMRNMAEKIGISAAYLSAIENGKRQIPDSIYDSICKAYPLSEKDKKKLKDSIVASSKTMKVDLTELAEKKKKVITKLMSDDLDDETLNKLCEIIEK
jgi:transcriptional regulator with XRE-family HTH domain